MRTIVYIDAQNLYFGVLARSSYKWLDIYKLFAEHIVHSQTPHATIIQIKFYTAPILGKFASDPYSSERQTAYHNALIGKYPLKIEIIQGYYAFDCKNERLCSNPEEKVHVWKLEEKLTDVNLALDIYRDASHDRYDQAVLCSNDSDLIPAFQRVSEDFPDKQLGLVMPRLSKKVTQRKASKLESLSTWTQHQISEADLKLCQLPDKVSYKRGKRTKTIPKPLKW